MQLHVSLYFFVSSIENLNQCLIPEITLDMLLKWHSPSMLGSYSILSKSQRLTFCVNAEKSNSSHLVKLKHKFYSPFLLLFKWTWIIVPPALIQTHEASNFLAEVLVSCFRKEANLYQNELQKSCGGCFSSVLFNNHMWVLRSGFNILWTIYT